MFKPVDGFRANLAMTPQQTVVPLRSNEASALCARLGSDYTYLTLRSAWGFEIVKATCSAGVVSIERGQAGTTPLGGDLCMGFEWTTPAMTDFMAQGGGAPAICAIEPASDRVTVETDGCTVKIDRPACAAVTWRDGNALLTMGEGGCVASENVAPAIALAAGTYKNATITIDEAGRITRIEEGENIVFTGGGCCTTSGEAP